MPPSSNDGPLWALWLLLVLTFVMGGGARGDVMSLMLLRPAAVLVVAYGLWGLTWDEVRRYRHLFLFVAAAVALILVHLVPLPPGIWTRLPGRDLIVAIDCMAGLGLRWRPISVAPDATWNSLFATIIPVAVLVLGARLSQEQIARTLMPVVVLGLVSATLALLQLIGPTDGPLYLYRVTNSGGAVGLFANRNHEAVMLVLLFPLLAMLALEPRARWEPQGLRAPLGLAACLFLVPLVLVTGSRFGLIGGAAAIAASAWLYWSGQRLRASARSGPPRRERSSCSAWL